MTVTSTPAARQASISSAARPKISGSPPLRPNDGLAGERELDHHAVDVYLLARRAVAGLADRDPAGLAPSELKHFGSDQLVVKDDGRRLEERELPLE